MGDQTWCRVCKDRPRSTGATCGREQCVEKAQDTKHFAIGCLALWTFLAFGFAFLLGWTIRGCSQ